MYLVSSLNSENEKKTKDNRMTLLKVLICFLYYLICLQLLWTISGFNNHTCISSETEKMHSFSVPTNCSLSQHCQYSTSERPSPHPQFYLQADLRPQKSKNRLELIKIKEKQTQNEKGEAVIKSKQRKKPASAVDAPNRHCRTSTS